MAPLLDYLRELGATPAAAAPATEAKQLQHHYRTFLVEEHGLAAGTVASYCTWPSCSSPPAPQTACCTRTG
jgi:hypothetical protein